MNDIEVLLDWLQDLAKNMREEIESLSVEDLAWQPDAEANTIGVTVWHMARWLDVLAVQTLQREAPEQEQWHTRGWTKKTGYDPRGIGYRGLGVVTGYTLEEVKVIPRLTAENLLAYFEQTSEALSEQLRLLPPGTLHQPPTPTSRRTVYESIKPILQGCFGHVGEIEALKAMRARTQLDKR